MNSRAYQFQLQAAEAAAAPVDAAEGGEPEVITAKALLLKIQAQGTAADEPAAPRQGSGALAPTMGTIGNAEAIKCPECPKWFASEKAMFGHLRKHPERGYKGATRPTAAASATAAAVAGDKKPTKKVPRRKEIGTGVVPAMNMAAAAATAVEKKAWEEAELSTKWPAAAKRGRTPVEPVPASSCCSEDEEAAMILLEMASSSRTSSETQQQQQSSVEPVRVPNAVSGHQIQTSSVVEQPMLLDHPAAHQTPEAEQQIVQSENALELSAESQTPSAPAAKQVTDLVITTETVLIVVPAANKPIVFPSLDSGTAGGDKKQAKKQRRVTNPDQTTASTSLPPQPTEGAVRTPQARRIPSPASNKKHACPTCGKSFPTHQALGGHMANHVKGNKTARNDDLAAAQAMKNILARRDQSAGAGDGNVIIPASAGAGALEERQDAQPAPRAPAPTPTPTPTPTQPAQAPTPQTPAPHVCDECHLIFRSGQALGGHKRKHWFPEKQQAKAAAAAPVPAPAPAAPVIEPESRDFDLNELPKEGQGENNTQP